MTAATGNCFENCGRFMMEHPNNQYTLVHCTVTGTGGSVKGIRYSHAFVITEDKKFALDFTHSMTQPTIVELEKFRMLGNIENELHYGFDEALSEMQRTQHFGAWDESVVTENDIIPKHGKKGKRWS